MRDINTKRAVHGDASQQYGNDIRMRIVETVAGNTNLSNLTKGVHVCILLRVSAN